MIRAPQRPGRRVVLLLALVPSLARGAGEAGPPPVSGERLAAVRRALREEGPGSPRAAALAASLESAGGLWPLRLRVARAAVALGAGGSTSPAPGLLLDTAPIGLPGLGPYLALLARHPSVTALLSFASAERYEPLARDAATLAARLSRTTAEKSAVRKSLAAWGARGAPTPRVTADLALARARVAATPAEARSLLLALAAERPDAPERDPDIFDATDRKAFESAVKSGPEEFRTARALALAARAPSEALSLLPRAPGTPRARLEAAEVRLVTGDPAGALRLLRTPAPPLRAGDAEAAHARALELTAELRLLLHGETARAPSRRPGRQRPRTVTTLPTPPPLFDAETRGRAAGLLARARDLLDGEIADADRRRLAADAARTALRAGEPGLARRLVDTILLADPGSTVLSEELFRGAFEAYRQGRFAEAAAAFDDQAALYRDLTVRRRAAYWAGRAREKGGEADAARARYAALVPGTSPDLYAAWAADALGLPPPPASPLPAGSSLETPPEGAAAGPPSREFLACGLPDLARDAAEAEGVTDPLFLADLDAERGDYRRATRLLKARWPELGSPEEGAVPLEARRAYYPLVHVAVVEEEAARAALPAALVFGLIRQESVFTPDVKSRAGAVGLMQLMPRTGRQLGRHEKRAGRPNLSDPAVNVRLGVTYLRQMLDAFGGDAVVALAAYNAGPGRARRWRRDLATLPVDEFVESIPAPESRLYVKRVLFFEGAYAALYCLPAPASQGPPPGGGAAPGLPR